MTRDAIKFLKARIDAVRWKNLEPPIPPKDIRALQRRLEDYNKIVNTDMSTRRSKMQLAATEATEVVLGGDYDKAVEAVKKFERIVF